MNYGHVLAYTHGKASGQGVRLQMTSDDKSSNKNDSRNPTAKPSSKAQSARDARLAENLRANLRRRKLATRKAKINKNEM